MLSKIKIPRIHACHSKDVKIMKHAVKPRVKPQVVIPQPLEDKKVNFDREITEFEVRVAMSASVLFFSMGMLATRRGDPGVYLPVITSIIGYWAPAPKKKED